MILRHTFGVCLIYFFWAWFVTPPVFGVALSLTAGGIIPHIGRKSKGFIGRNEEIAKFLGFFGIWGYSWR